jgi:excisionase family DNA binding protein
MAMGVTMRIHKRRKPEPPITDPATHPRQSVCLRVAADYLELDERTVRARIESGDLPAIKDGKVYRIDLSSLIAYEQRRRLAS